MEIFYIYKFSPSGICCELFSSDNYYEVVKTFTRIFKNLTRDFSPLAWPIGDWRSADGRDYGFYFNHCHFGFYFDGYCFMFFNEYLNPVSEPIL